ncbi:S1 family peptidase [Vibrio renipiscarius]|uniref:Peptidase S1 domain-containing protein n=1 Tax=Vibrio renipiscarius TaxID=1461322 RepID=A0A0C2K2L1_9VIBR|nr:trypsin-like serine protease [Vibrio renipiscarius]KII76198.1 hypothetical protein OJ16_15405 [Vibrio renipiscarius]KII78280.1 hypothetical protein PL18_15165 [Vibrio renipiscarius]
MRKLILSGSLLMSVCAHSLEVSPYIINGTDVVIADYPNVASLFYEDENGNYTRSFCGATVINDRYVLTAAHCIAENEDLDKITVVSQLVDETDYASVAPQRVSEYFFPSTFVNSASALWPDDIAILKLESDLGTGDLIGQLNLDSSGDLASNDTYKIVGHGLIYDASSGQYINENNLLEATLTPLTLSQCKTAWGDNFTAKQYCFDGTLPNGILQNSPCDGDSGGPVYQFTASGYVQIGITSFGLAQCGDPALSTEVTSGFTNVAAYEEWITTVLNGEVTPVYQVVLEDGERVVIDRRSNNSEDIVPAESGGSGANLSIAALLGLLIVFHLRHSKRLRNRYLSNLACSQN